MGVPALHHADGSPSVDGLGTASSRLGGLFLGGPHYSLPLWSGRVTWVGAEELSDVALQGRVHVVERSIPVDAFQ